MRLTRRRFLATDSAVAIAGRPVRTWSATQLDLGGTLINTTSDGHLVLPLDFVLLDRTPEHAAPFLIAHRLPIDRLEPPCNLTLLRDGTNTLMFDAGSGADFMPSAGRLTNAPDAMDLAPEDITHVVFTNDHPDTCGARRTISTTFCFPIPPI